MIIESIAHLIAPSGKKYQVLNADGTDWDEVATTAAYKAAEGIFGPVQLPSV